MIIGKLVGAALGSLINVPFGTLFGLWLGHKVDRAVALSHHGLHFFTIGLGHAQSTFFDVTFSVMGHIAKADGRVSANEIKMAQALMSRMRLSTEQRQIAIERFQQGKADDFDFEAALNKLRQACHGNIVLLRLFVELQQQAAMVDGLSEKKRQLLEQISRILGADPFFSAGFNYDYGSAGQQRTHAGPPPIADPYAVLNIDSSASDAEVKRAYRRLMSQNHPDKLASQGLSEEMIKLATEKTQGIQAAYEQIRQQRGIK